MQSCQFAKSVSERWSGKFFAARLTAVSSASCCTVAAGRALFSSVTTTRCWQRFSVVRVYECCCPGARKFCWATWWTFELNFVRQKSVTDSVLPSGPYIHSALVWTVLAVCITCYSWDELLFILFRFGGSAFCVSPVFVRGRCVDLLLLSRQSLLHSSFAFALFFHLRYRSAGGAL